MRALPEATFSSLIQDTHSRLSAEEAALAQRLAALLQQSGSRGGVSGLDAQAAGGDGLAALQSLWQQSQRLVPA